MGSGLLGPSRVVYCMGTSAPFSIRLAASGTSGGWMKAAKKRLESVLTRMAMQSLK
jgi:hypothetical protein